MTLLPKTRRKGNIFLLMKMVLLNVTEDAWTSTRTSFTFGTGLSTSFRSKGLSYPYLVQTIAFI